MDNKELNLNNPIFVYYFDTEKKPTALISNKIEALSKQLSYSNVTFWIVATNYTKIECVYDGKSSDKEVVIKLQNFLQNLMEKYPYNEFLENFEKEIRDFTISNLLD